MTYLVRSEKHRLEAAIGNVPYVLVDLDKTSCEVITDRFTVTFAWWLREQWVNADIKLQEVGDPPICLHSTYSARTWLEARGLPTLPRRSGTMSVDLLQDELESVANVVSDVFSDAQATTEALIYKAGCNSGYTDRVVVPEQAPPACVQEWAVVNFQPPAI
ncbi:MAG: hypothetical protein ACKVOP_00875 [Sphingomonadaceae bacterium]